MVKSTVRFPKEVMDCVEEMVETGKFSSKSEFQRFAVEYILSEAGEHEPEMVDFEEIRREVLPRDSPIQEVSTASNTTEEFVEVATRVRQFAARGELATAENYIDTHYPPTDPRSMLLDDLLSAYRTADHDSPE